MVNYIKNIKKQDILIEELKNTIEELKNKDQLKNDFINVAAHEMKHLFNQSLHLLKYFQQGRRK